MMFETALIDRLRSVSPSTNFALEFASTITVPMVVISTDDEDEVYGTNGKVIHCETQLSIQCFAKDSVSAKALSKNIKKAIHSLPESMGGYALVGKSTSNEFSGHSKDDDLYFREFTFNASYKEK